ncbi:MAG: carbohydrate ABC transporter permease [Candidatus Caldatribacterium sp.]|nr:carbohydrate ABC transporter permease [Candidatus Caldatribacterium sp.]
MFLTSFKPEADVVTYPPRLFPRDITLANYVDIWKRIPFSVFFLNTLIFAGSVTLLSLFLDSLTAYALSRLSFPGRDVIFLVILATLMVPFHVIMISLFVTIYRMGWVNTYAALIVPRATNAFGIFMLRQFFLTIPPALEDAARIDGCSEFRIYWQIILPLSKPALATLAVFHFMYNWNDLLWPLIVTTSTRMRTLPAGLALFMGKHVVEYAILMAGATIALAPLILGFLFAQRYFVRGIVLTGLKE